MRGWAAPSSIAVRVLGALLLVLGAVGVGAEPCRGSVVAIGGAVGDDNHAIWGRVVQLATAVAGTGARIGLVTTSSPEPERSARENAALLQRHGAVVELLPLPAGAAGVAAAQDAALAARLAGLNGLFFSGGAQAKLLDVLLQADGQPSPLLRAMHALHCRGGVVAGSSAGAAVMSAVAFRDGPEPLSALKASQRLARDGHEVGRGLGFAPAAVVLDQHFVKRGRIGRLLPLLVERRLPLGLGVEEDSAAVISGLAGAEVVEAIGSRGVLVVDARAAERDAALPAFNVRNVRLSWLERGDRLELASHRFLPSGRNPPLALRQRTPARWFHADMLGDNVIVEAMTRLARSTRAATIGLSFTALPEPDDPAPRLAFEWTLEPDERTRAWRGDGDMVVDMLLHVRPVQLAMPLTLPVMPGR